jgi:hypothetical protein
VERGLGRVRGLRRGFRRVVCGAFNMMGLEDLINNDNGFSTLYALLMPILVPNLRSVFY